MTRRYQAQVNDRAFEVSVGDEDAGTFAVTIDNRTRRVDACPLGAGAWSIIVDGAVYAIDLEGDGGERVAHVGDHAVPVRIVDARRKLLVEAGRRAAKAGPLAVRSPMPGKVVKVLVAAGMPVSVGQGLIVVEAMKMENEMRAPRDGTVAAISVREGQTVEAGETLATLS